MGGDGVRIAGGRWCAGAALALAIGCSLLRPEARSPSTLPAARMSPDAVVVDIFTVDVSRDLTAPWDEAWRQLDEQHLPPEVRLRLAANGLRCGRCGLQLPPPLSELLEQSQTASRQANSFEQGPPGALVRRRLQSRAGRRQRIVLSGPHETLEALYNESGQMRGEVHRHATCVLALRTFPLGDGRVRIELTPEIEHGPLKQRLVEGGGALRWESGQDRRVFDSLCMETRLAPGQTLILSATPSLAGLGRAFFVRQASDGLRPVCVVIRVAQTQHDDRFAPEQIVAPLVTPSE